MGSDGNRRRAEGGDGGGRGRGGGLLLLLVDVDELLLAGIELIKVGVEGAAQVEGERGEGDDNLAAGEGVGVVDALGRE